MKIAVLDDEKQAADVLVGYLKQYEKEKQLNFEINVFSAAESLLEGYDCSYKILFLDIEMAGMNGLQVAKLIRAKDEHVVIVFITNMAQLALHGYDVGAVDFIIKPLNYEKFLVKAQKIFRRLPIEDADMLILRTVDGIINLPAASLRYLETNKNYIYYHIDDNVYKVRSTMSEALAKLSPTDFAQISNCNVVNLKYITKINQKNIEMGAVVLPLSRSKKAAFMEKYISFMERM